MPPSTLYFGDARHMTDLGSESVQLIVTSPPYWQLKDYGAAGQIGFGDSYEAYISALNRVWVECFRVLSPGCRMCVNIGDQFARAAHYGRYKVIPIREKIVAECENLGLDYMGAVIWQKTTTMNTSGGGAVMGSFPHPRNGILKIDYEFILIFKKLGTPPKVSPAQKAAAAMTTAEWNQFFAGHWNFAGEKQSGGHIAMFPRELPRRLIKMFSFPGETVLDPFAGSGTTLGAALELGRRGVGYEINPAFEPAIRARLNGQKIEFRVSAPPSPQIAAPVAAATNALERRINPKKYRFGSVISAEDESNSKGQRVRKILAPHRLILEDGGEIRLLGIAPRAEREAEALDYLRQMVLNKAVFLKFSGEMHNKNGGLQAYVYLANKTFINAKLIKRGLAQADESEHRYAERFRDYQANSMVAAT